MRSTDESFRNSRPGEGPQEEEAGAGRPVVEGVVVSEPEVDVRR